MRIEIKDWSGCLEVDIPDENHLLHIRKLLEQIGRQDATVKEVRENGDRVRIDMKEK